MLGLTKFIPATQAEVLELEQILTEGVSVHGKTGVHRASALLYVASQIADGRLSPAVTLSSLARAVNMSRGTLRRLCSTFFCAQEGARVEALKGISPPGRNPKPERIRRRVIEILRHFTPHSSGMVAHEVSRRDTAGVSAATVRRIRRESGIRAFSYTRQPMACRRSTSKDSSTQPPPMKSRRGQLTRLAEIAAVASDPLSSRKIKQACGFLGMYERDRYGEDFNVELWANHFKMSRATAYRRIHKYNASSLSEVVAALLPGKRRLKEKDKKEAPSSESVEVTDMPEIPSFDAVSSNANERYLWLFLGELSLGIEGVAKPLRIPFAVAVDDEHRSFIFLSNVWGASPRVYSSKKIRMGDSGDLLANLNERGLSRVDHIISTVFRSDAKSLKKSFRLTGPANAPLVNKPNVLEIPHPSPCETAINEARVVAKWYCVGELFDSSWPHGIPAEYRIEFYRLLLDSLTASTRRHDKLKKRAMSLFKLVKANVPDGFINRRDGRPDPEGKSLREKAFREVMDKTHAAYLARLDASACSPIITSRALRKYVGGLGPAREVKTSIERGAQLHDFHSASDAFAFVERQVGKLQGRDFFARFQKRKKRTATAPTA